MAADMDAGLLQAILHLNQTELGAGMEHLLAEETQYEIADTLSSHPDSTEMVFAQQIMKMPLGHFALCTGGRGYPPGRMYKHRRLLIATVFDSVDSKQVPIDAKCTIPYHRGLFLNGGQNHCC